MNKFRKKQRAAKTVRNTAVLVTAAAFLIYITLEPTLTKMFGNAGVFQMILFGLVAAALALVFLYEAKYGKAERFADDAEYKIKDAGYYFAARDENSVDEYLETVKTDLLENGFRLQNEVAYEELVFDAVAAHHAEYIYLVKIDSADKNDVIAYTDAAVNDITSRLLKRRGNAIAVLLCNRAEESAAAISKTYTQIQTGRRAAITVYPVIVEVSSKKVFCLGNKISPAQKLIFNYIMNCDLPVKEQYICREKLPFQLELEEKMRQFDYKNLP